MKAAPISIEMSIEKVMNKEVKFCYPSDSLNIAAQKMWEFGIGSLPVVDHEHRALGMITDRDIAMAAYTRGRLLDAIRVDETFSGKLWSARLGESSTKAEEQMRKGAVRRVPVLDAADHLVGIVSIDDLARNARESGPVTHREVTETLIAVSAQRAAMGAGTH